MMKGFITDIGWSVAVWVIAFIVILSMIMYFIFFQYEGSDPIGYSIKVVEISNRPYLIAGSLFHFQIGDRQFLEHAIESSTVGSLSNSYSGDVPHNIHYFLKYVKY